MRRALLVCGLLTLTAVWLGPLPQLARQAFWAHMTLHMGVVAVAAPLLTLGVAGGRLDPVRHAPRLFAQRGGPYRLGSSTPSETSLPVRVTDLWTTRKERRGGLATCAVGQPPAHMNRLSRCGAG